MMIRESSIETGMMHIPLLNGIPEDRSQALPRSASIIAGMLPERPVWSWLGMQITRYANNEEAGFFKLEVPNLQRSDRGAMRKRFLPVGNFFYCNFIFPSFNWRIYLEKI